MGRTGLVTGLVTDSTSYLPSTLTAGLPLTVVPLTVALADRTGAETTDVTPSEVAAALRSGVPVTTSRPTPEHFLAAYDELLDDGAESVVSIHLSAELSGTWDSARVAAEERNASLGREAVVALDSRQICMGLGFAVLAAASAASSGASAGEVVAAAQRCAERTTTLFYVDTLEHLRRGGRVGAAQALVGTALAVKPLLQVQGGRITPLEKVRTSAKAIGRLRELAVAAALAGGSADGVRVAVQHLAAQERADEVATALRTALPGAEEIVVGEIGAVVGAHVGPGVVGVVVTRP